MAFRFQKASCVVAGTFNMYIVHPEWLARHKIIERGTEVGIETNLAQPGFRFHFPKDEPTWSVAPNRVAVESQDPETNCGTAIAKILRVLPETPLFGLGNNVVYEADLSELDNLAPAIRDFPWPESPNKGETVRQKTFHVSVQRTEYEVANLQIAVREDKIELSCNLHSKLENRPDFNGAAITAAERFVDDREYSKISAKHFFGTSIDHGSPDT